MAPASISMLLKEFGRQSSRANPHSELCELLTKRLSWRLRKSTAEAHWAAVAGAPQLDGFTAVPAGFVISGLSARFNSCVCRLRSSALANQNSFCEPAGPPALIPLSTRDPGGWKPGPNLSAALQELGLK